MSLNQNKARPGTLGYLLIAFTMISMSFAFDLYFKVTDVRYSYVAELEDELQKIDERESVLKDFQALLDNVKYIANKNGGAEELTLVINELDEYVNDAYMWASQRRMDIETKLKNYGF